ncbi:MAG: ribonuclease R [Syntrophorhabdales bacterium]|jgi:ribonuclease R
MKKSLPIDLTKRDLLDVFKRQERPLSLDDLKGMVDSWKSRKREIKDLLRELTREGSLVRLKNNRFGIPDEMNLEVGTLWCTRSGNGFVVPDKGGEKDVFVPSRFIKGALHGDKVVVRVEHSRRGKREGQIVKVTERKTRNVTGFLEERKGLLFLVPDDERISARFIVEPGKAASEWEQGDLAAAKVTRFPETGDPECKLLKVFKGLDDVKKISQFIVHKHGLSHRFPRNAEGEARQMGFSITMDGRLDLRGMDHVTIDGELAKDFDDAVFVEKTKDGFLLYVSIADVSHYVKRDSPLDREAYARGTSVYFPGTVIPMLPKQLSNVICSLNPYEERMTLTVRLGYNSKGELLQASFDRSVIKSVRRLTYHAVEDALVGKDRKTRESLKGLMPMLEHMGHLARLLKKRREQRGNLDFDLPEPKLVLDMEGGIKDVLRSERLFSQGIIEEFMIAANEAVAHFIADRKMPLIYRVHESPDREKLQDFEKLLRVLAVPYHADPKGRLPLQKILRNVRDKEHEFLINRILLKSMKQARYSAINKGHFGLALDFYSHFTSPIRRYPDLVCHRILKALIQNEGKERMLYGEEELGRMALHLSERERAAMEAERETEDRIRVLFMKDRTGQTFDGIISHITSYGFFVELFEVFVEGIVLLSTLHDDYYAFEEEKFRLIGRRTRKVFRIGDHVKIKVETADVEKNILHFLLAKGR